MKHLNTKCLLLQSVVFLLLSGCGSGGATQPPPPVNATPSAQPETYQLNEDSELTAQLSASDADGDALTFFVVTDVTYGTLNLTTAGEFTFTPNANYNGADSFQFRVNDGTTNSVNATVSIEILPVNDPPVAVDDIIYVSYQQLKSDSPLANDINIDGGTLTITLLSAPSNGTTQLFGSTLEYTPNNKFVGSDTLLYEITDLEGIKSAAKIDFVVRRSLAFQAPRKTETAVTPTTLYAKHPYDSESFIQLSHQVADDSYDSVQTFSPSKDGKYIYYTFEERDSDLLHLYRTEVANPDNILKISENIGAGNSLYFSGNDQLVFYPSPDNTKVGFTIIKPNNEYAFLIAEINSNVVEKLVTVSNHIVRHGEFSVDSNYLFIRRVDQAQGSVHNLYRIDTLNNYSLKLINSVQLTSITSSNRNQSPFELSPDGFSIYYMGRTQFDETDVYRGNFSAGFQNFIVSAKRTYLSGSVSEFLLMPNGQNVVYLANHESSNIRADLYLANVSGDRIAVEVNLPINYDLQDITTFILSNDSNKVGYIFEPGGILTNQLELANVNNLPEQLTINSSFGDGTEVAYENSTYNNLMAFSNDDSALYYLLSKPGETNLLYKTNITELGQSVLISPPENKPYSYVSRFIVGDLGEMIFCGRSSSAFGPCYIYLTTGNQTPPFRIDSDIEDSGLNAGQYFKLVPKKIN